MRASWLLLFLAVPLAAELKQLVIRFEPSECVSCTQSLPERLRRIRGVSEAVLRLGAQPELAVRLAEGNRVRVGRIRETIEQDGTKWRSARVAAAGICERRGDEWLLRLFDGDAGIPVKGKVEAGACSLTGTVGIDGTMVVD